MISASRKWLLSGAAAVLVGPGASAQDFDLSGSRFEIGERAQVVVTGVPGTEFSLLFDTATGDRVLPGGARLGLGFSKDFAILYSGSLPPDSRLRLEFGLSDSPNLVGEEFFLQAAGTRPEESAWITTPRLDRVVGDGEAGSILEARPGPGTPMEADGSFEVWVDRGLSDVSVDERTVRLRREDTGEELALAVSLVEHRDAATIVAHPRRPLPREVPLTLELAPEIRDDGGNPLSGTRRFCYRLERRRHPLLMTSADQVELFKDRVQRRVQPWSDSFDSMRAEADSEAMEHTPRPHVGPPPATRSQYVDVYARWFTSARYAQDLALAYLVSGETCYAEKAREILRAWLVFRPAAVGKWHWAIQTDIAGLCTVDALDLLWDYEGLTPADRAGFRAFLGGLAEAAKTWQRDESDRDPECIRSWTNTLLVAVGTLLERPDLVDFAIERGRGNPFPFLDLFERAMDERGRMFDEYRGAEEPAWGVTYPLYHLQAWALLGEIARNQGRDLFRRRDADGNTQERGWSHYLRYLDGTVVVEGLSPRLLRDSCIAKYYPAQRVYARSEFERLFSLHGGEPLFDPHLRKKSTTFSQKVPYAGPDEQPPARPGDVVPISIGCTTLQLRWGASPFDDESDLAVAYEVRRDGALLRRTAVACFHDRELQPGCSYHYEVRPVDAAGNVGPPVQRTVTTLVPPRD